MIQPLRSARVHWALDWYEVTTPVVKEGAFELPTCIFVLGAKGAQLIGSESLREIDQRRVESFLARLIGERGAPDALTIAAHAGWDATVWKSFAEEFRVTVSVVDSVESDPSGLMEVSATHKAEMAARLIEPLRRLAASQPAEQVAKGLVATALQLQSEQRSEQMLQAAVKCDPACVDALLGLGESGFRRGEFSAALAHYQQVCRIEWRRWQEQSPDWWADHATRPYLKALFGQMFVLWHIGRLEEAGDAGERLLTLNAADNQGVRFLLPMLYLLAERQDVAVQYFSTYQKQYPNDFTEPAFLFAWGFAAAQRDDEKTCRLRYRQGMLKNIYVAPLLLDAQGPRQDIWHPNDRAEPNYAYEFFDSFALLWERDPQSLRALREVYDTISEALAGLVELRSRMVDLQDQRFDPEHEKVWQAIVTEEKALVKRLSEEGA